MSKIKVMLSFPARDIDLYHKLSLTAQENKQSVSGLMRRLLGNHLNTDRGERLVELPRWPWNTGEYN